MIDSKNYSVYSFDIFDTLITRRTARPEGIFTLVQEKLKTKIPHLPSDLLNNFATIRNSIESFVRINLVVSGISQDVYLDDIYQRLVENYAIPEEDVNLIKQIEMETEFENWVLIQENVSLINELKRMGKKVILVSDMYIPEQILKSFLSKLDPIFKDIPIYVSGNRKLTKHFGDLFDFVAKQEDIKDRSKWLHIGDNAHADVKIPLQKNLNSYQFLYPSLAKYEEYIKKHPQDFTAQLLIGQSKLMRLTPQHPKFVFASSFVAPILYQYVDFIIQQSLHRDITDLYFLARDGFILRLIADEIIRARELKIRTHYFYASRKTIRIPNAINIKDFLQTCLYETGIYTLEKNDNFLSYFSEFANIPLDLVEHHFSNGTELKNNLYKGTFVQNVLTYFQQKKDLLIEYFNQEVSKDSKFAFVDLEGSGRSVNLLASILKKKLLCFYFIMVPPAKCRDDFEAIIFSHRLEREPQIVELFCRYWEGQCAGYRKEGNRVVAVLENDLSQAFEKWGWEYYIKGIQIYARQLSQYLQTKQYNITTSFDLISYYLNWLSTEVDEQTAEILGSIPWTNLGNETNSQAAPPFGFWDHLRRYYFGNKGSKPSEFMLLSEKRTSKVTKKLIRFFCPISVRRTETRRRVYLWGNKIISMPRHHRRK